MNVAVFLPNWMGDAVMATPTLRALREHFGRRATLRGVMRPAVAELLSGTPWLDESVLFAPRSRHKEWGSLAVVGQLWRPRTDVAVLLSNSLRTALLAFFAGAKNRIGYARYGRGGLLTHPVAAPRQGDHWARMPMVDYYLDLVAELGCARPSPRLELATGPADEQAADVVWRKHRLGSQPVVVLNSSGAFGAAKLWPVEHFAALAQRIAGDLQRDVLVLCGPSERQIAAAIVEQARHPRVVSLAEEPLSIGLSKACVRRAELMVTTDSGPRHFAVAFGVPVIGLFGPTPPVWGHNPTAQAIDLQVDLDCSGCHERQCPLVHHRCMRDLSVDRVFGEVARWLSRPQRRQAA